jgi:hypothetical protein
MEKLLYLIFLSVFLLTFSCSASINREVRYTNNIFHNERQRTVSIYLDKDFVPQEKLAIEAAISDWNIVLNNVIFLEIVSYNFDMDIDILQKVNHSKNDWLFLKVLHSNPLVLEEDKENGELVGAFSNQTNTIYVVSDRILEEKQYRGIIRHEIGHNFGAVHTKKHNLMFHRYEDNAFKCIDFDTVSQIARFNGLDIGKLNYCQ